MKLHEIKITLNPRRFKKKKKILLLLNRIRIIKNHPGTKGQESHGRNADDKERSTWRPLPRWRTTAHRGRLDASQDRQAAFEESMECLARLKFQNRALFGFRQFGAKPSRPPSFSARAFLECFGACVCVRVARNFAYTEGGETHRLLLVEIERSGRGWGRCKTFRIIIYPLYRINNFGFEYPPSSPLPESKVR